ncbi:hypothetical protein ACFYO0_27010 [Streptomyces sp. NPDC006365]
MATGDRRTPKAITPMPRTECSRPSAVFSGTGIAVVADERAVQL